MYLFYMKQTLEVSRDSGYFYYPVLPVGDDIFLNVVLQHIQISLSALNQYHVLSTILNTRKLINIHECFISRTTKIETGNEKET